MRLFLSSYRAGRHDKELLNFLGNIRKVAYISNAKDYKTPKDRREKIKENFEYYQSIGIKPTEIDLRPYFGKSGAEELFSKFDFIWLAGGNAFLLRRALKQTGMDIWLGDRVRKNEILYGGESAGAIMAGPTLHGSEAEEGDEDNPHFIPEGYDKRVIWEALNFISYVPVPHYGDPDYGDEINKYVDYLKKQKLPYKTMTNDQAVIINGDKEEFLE